MEKTSFIKHNLLFVLISFVMIIFSCSSAKGYERGEVIPVSDYLTFTAQEDNSYVYPDSQSGSMQYSKDNGAHWYDAKGVNIKLNKGESIKLKGTNVSTFNSNHFSMSGKISASGCVDSLRLDINSKFQGLSNYCYSYMFWLCESLTEVPKLPAKNLADHCYDNMFSDCTSLVSTYALPKSDVADCYTEMFSGCKNLKLCTFNEHYESFENYILPSNTIVGIFLNYENSINDIANVRNSSLGENSEYFVSYRSSDYICININNNFIIDSDFSSFIPEKEKSKIESIEFEKSPKEIKNKAFAGLNNLKSIIFKDKISNMTLNTNPFPSMIGSKEVMEMIRKKQSQHG